MNSYVGMTMVKKEEGQDDYYTSVDRAPRHMVVVVCLCVCVSAESLPELVLRIR